MASDCEIHVCARCGELVPVRIPGARPTESERFWSKVDKSGDCWEWRGSLSGSLGYGQFRPTRSEPRFAHRVSFEWAFGEIPSGMFVCHRCDNPKCVKPSHLFLATHQQNMADMVSKGRASGGQPRGGQRVVGMTSLARSVFDKVV